MNSAQHAGEILQAWKVSDPQVLEMALDSALLCCKAKREVSRYEFERREILESVVQHLRTFRNGDTFPQPPCGKGALTLLSHLSLNPSPFGVSGSGKAHAQLKTLKVRH